jgi:hypothetical protein
MKVVVPFATSAAMLPAVELALRQDGVEADFRHMTADDSYYQLLVELWRGRETFALVEHDIIPWPGALQQLENCPEAWCTFPYYCSVGWIEDGLGCVKFGKELLVSHPSFLDEPFPPCCNHTKYYCGLDRLIAHRCEQLGIAPHVHAPGVVNLNERWT